MRSEGWVVPFSCLDAFPGDFFAITIVSMTRKMFHDKKIDPLRYILKPLFCEILLFQWAGECCISQIGLHKLYPLTQEVYVYFIRRILALTYTKALTFLFAQDTFEKSTLLDVCWLSSQLLRNFTVSMKWRILLIVAVSFIVCERVGLRSPG